MFKSFFSVTICSFFLTIFSSSFYSAIAAEKIIFRYGMWQESLSIGDLSEFCITGETTSTLEYYLRTSRQKKSDINKILCQPLPINGVALSKALNNPLGDILLGFFGEIITTPSQRASRESLRGALITSALRNNEISIVETLENYPTNEVHLNGDRMMEIYQQIEPLLNMINKLR